MSDRNSWWLGLVPIAVGSYMILCIKSEAAYIRLEPSKDQRSITSELARMLGDKIGVDWSEVSLDQFLRGLDVEREHGRGDPQTNVTNDDPVLTAKIALAHLKEVPDYYTKLRMVEEKRVISEPFKEVERGELSSIIFPNNRDYTHNSLVEELGLIERHVRDGSWEFCNCNPEKHLPLVAGLSSEGVGFSESEDEKTFMSQLRDKAKEFKQRIDIGSFKEAEADELREWARDMRKRVEEEKWCEATDKECPTCSENIGVAWALKLAREIKMPDIDTLEKDVLEERVSPGEGVDLIISYAKEKGDNDSLETLMELKRMMYTSLSDLESETKSLSDLESETKNES